MISQSQNSKELFTFDVGAIQLCEFDLGGVLYHANYFHLFEKAREALFRENEIPYEHFVANREHLAVVEARQKFLKPVYYGDKLRIEVFVKALKRSTVTFYYEIYKISTPDVLVHSAFTKHVFVKDEGDGFKVKKIPSKLQEVLEKYIRT